MPRTMTTGVYTALCSAGVRLALLADLQFGDNTLHLWTGITPFAWSGNTYTGVGTLGTVEGISEDSNVEANGVKLTLSGIPSSLVMEVLYEVRVLRNANLWLAVFDASGALIPDPILAYQGKMDEPQISDDGQTCTVTISLENVLVDLNRPTNRRYTDQDQQLDLADTLTRLGLSSTTVDTGFTHVAGIQERITFWGRSPSSVNNV